MLGTIVNAAAIVVGGFVGSLLKKGLPQRYEAIVFQALGLFTLVISLSMVLKMQQMLLCVFSLLIGALVGEFFRLDQKVLGFGEWLKAKVRLKNEKFSEGFIAASLLYCVGSMAILGAIEEGSGKFPLLLLTKSVMDGFTAIAFASAFGYGVLFSAISVFIYQAGLTLLFILFGTLLSEPVINELTAVGGILLLGLAFDLLGMKKIKVVNLLPSLIVIIVLAYIF